MSYMQLPSNLSPELRDYVYNLKDEDQKSEINIKPQDIKILETWLSSTEGTNWIEQSRPLAKRLIRSIAASPISEAISNKLIHIFIDLHKIKQNNETHSINDLKKTLSSCIKEGNFLEEYRLSIDEPEVIETIFQLAKEDPEIKSQLRKLFREESGVANLPNTIPAIKLLAFVESPFTEKFLKEFNHFDEMADEKNIDLEFFTLVAKNHPSFFENPDVIMLLYKPFQGSFLFEKMVSHDRLATRRTFPYIAKNIVPILKDNIVNDPASPILRIYRFLEPNIQGKNELHEVLMEQIKNKKIKDPFVHPALHLIFHHDLEKSISIMLEGDIFKLKTSSSIKTFVNLIDKSPEIKEKVAKYFDSKENVMALPLCASSIQLLVKLNNQHLAPFLLKREYNQNILHMMAKEIDRQEFDPALVELIATKFPEEFDQLLFETDVKGKRPFEYLENKVFFDLLLKLKEDIFLTPDENGKTFFHRFPHKALEKPELFRKQEHKNILFNKINGESVFDALIKLHLENILKEFSSWADDIIAYANEKLGSDSTHPIFQKIDQVFKLASREALIELVNSSIKHNHAFLLEQLILFDSQSKDADLFRHVKQNKALYRKFCEMVITNPSSSEILLDKWPGAKDNFKYIIADLIKRTSKIKIHNDDLIRYIRKLDSEEINELAALAIEHGNKNIFYLLFYPTGFDTQRFPYDAKDEAAKKKLIKVLDKAIVHSLLAFSENKKDTLAYLMPLVPKLTTEELTNHATFYDQEVYSTHDEEIIQFLNDYPDVLRTILLAKNKPAGESYSAKKLIDLLVEHAPKIWETSDYGKRNLLHALAELDPELLEYAIEKPQLEKLKDRADDTGRKPTQVCFEKFPGYFMDKEDKTVAREGFLFIEKDSQKSFLHKTDKVKDLGFLYTVAQFLSHENLVDRVMSLEDKERHKPYYNILKQNPVSHDHATLNAIKWCFDDLKIPQFLKENNKTNQDLIYEIMLDETKTEWQINYVSFNLENFEIAIDKLINDKRFRFSKETARTLFTIIKNNYPDKYLQILNLIPNIKKGDVPQFIDLLFYDPNNIDKISKAIGVENLRKIIHKNCFSYFIHSNSWASNEENFNEDLFLKLHEVYPNLIIYTIEDYTIFKYIFKGEKWRSPLAKELFEKAILPNHPFIENVYKQYVETKSQENGIFFKDYFYQHFDDLCKEPDPFKIAWMLNDNELIERVAKKIGVEATFRSIADIRKWYPSDFELPNENIFFEFDPTHLQLEEIDPAMMQTMETINIEEILNIFDQINFNDPSDVNYFDPEKLKNDIGIEYVKVSPEDARESLEKLIKNIKEKNPAFGTFEEGTEILETYYKQLESVLKQIIFHCREIDKASQEGSFKDRRDAALEKIDAILTMAIAGLHCAGRWIGDALLTLELLKKEQLDLEKILLRIQANHRLNIAEQMAFESAYKGDVHALNTILVMLGPEFKIPGYEYIIDKFHAKFEHEDLRNQFLSLYNANAITENICDKIKEKELYKNLVMQWFKQNLGDYKKEEYAKKVQELQADTDWQDLLRAQTRGKLTEEAENTLAFLNYAKSLPKERIQEFLDDVKANIDDLNFLLVPLIRSSIVVPENITNPHERMNYQSKIVTQVLKEKETVLKFLESYQNLEDQEVIKANWTVSKEKGDETFINSIMKAFEEKDVAISAETIRMLLSEKDTDVLIERFKEKIAELLERQRSDEYLDEVYVVSGTDGNDEEIYDFDRAKILEMLTSFNILQPTA